MKKRICLVDPCHRNQMGLGSDTMPLQLGLVGAFCLKELGDRVDVALFKFIDEFEAEVAKNPPFIIGFSNYLWNIHLGTHLARILKQRFPGVIIVFGGPNYPEDHEDQVAWLREHPEVDFYIHKDGEIPFARLVAHLLEQPDVAACKRALLPAVHAVLDGEPLFGAPEPRLQDLTQVPSPYIMGLMDRFFDQPLVPSVQTSRGCPFRCTFCTEGGDYYNKVYRGSLEKKKTELDYIVARVKHTKILRISDSNFGMFPQDVELCEYIGGMQKHWGYPDFLACSAGKNRKERVLKCNELVGGAMRLAASVQSLDPEILANVRRSNISLDDIMHLSDQVSDTGTHSYSEIILGLPGDSLDAQMLSMDGLMRAGISNITQHQLALVHGTEVSTRESRAKFQLRGRFRPVQRCYGHYHFLGESFDAVEVEEISTGTAKLSLENYLEARRLYLTCGLFYNDRVFGEIHAFLRIMGLGTFGWIREIHENIAGLPEEIRSLYEEFTRETRDELYDSPEVLRRDVAARLEDFVSGRVGGNLIYKYRARSLITCWEQLSAVAFERLAAYLARQNVRGGVLLDETRSFFELRKGRLFDVEMEGEQTFQYDLHRMIFFPSSVRAMEDIEALRGPVTIRFCHTPDQKKLMYQLFDQYGRDLVGMTMLLSRFPVKRFYREVIVQE